MSDGEPCDNSAASADVQQDAAIGGVGPVSESGADASPRVAALTEHTNAAVQQVWCGAWIVICSVTVSRVCQTARAFWSKGSLLLRINYGLHLFFVCYVAWTVHACISLVRLAAPTDDTVVRFKNMYGLSFGLLCFLMCVSYALEGQLGWLYEVCSVLLHVAMLVPLRAYTSGDVALHQRWLGRCYLR